MWLLIDVHDTITEHRYVTDQRAVSLMRTQFVIASVVWQSRRRSKDVQLSVNPAGFPIRSYGIDNGGH